MVIDEIANKLESYKESMAFFDDVSIIGSEAFIQFLR